MSPGADGFDAPDRSPGPGAGDRPAPLAVAASLAALEGVVLVLYGGAELFALSGRRLQMGLTTSVFFLLYGGGLVVAAVALSRLRSWARAPVVLAQLIQLGVAWSFWGGDSVPVSLALALVAVAVLGGVFHPRSLVAVQQSDR